MFIVRIHTVDSAAAAAETAAETLNPHTSPAVTSTSAATAPSRHPNPRISSIRGLIHLYRTHAAAAAAAAAAFLKAPASLPSARGTLLFVLAVPNSLSPDNFLRFCGPDADRAAAVRDDGMEDRYSWRFGDQKAADTFYLNQNGWRFLPAEEVCYILFLESVEYTDCTEVVGTPPAGATELPTCTVCLERLDQDISGIFATTGDHSFQCACILKWINSSCMGVCHILFLESVEYTECTEVTGTPLAGATELPTCTVCLANDSLVI